jgi:hypothetical protein
MMHDNLINLSFHILHLCLKNLNLLIFNFGDRLSYFFVLFLQSRFKLLIFQSVFLILPLKLTFQGSLPLSMRSFYNSDPLFDILIDVALVFFNLT